jgi:hypothetical protein
VVGGGSVGSSDGESGSGSQDESGSGSESGCVEDCISDTYWLNICGSGSGGGESGSGEGEEEPDESGAGSESGGCIDPCDGSGSGSEESGSVAAPVLPPNINLPEVILPPIPQQPAQFGIFAGGIIGGILDDNDEDKENKFTVDTIELIGTETNPPEANINIDFYVVGSSPPNEIMLTNSIENDPSPASYDYSPSSSIEYASIAKGLRREDIIPLIIDETNNLELTLSRAGIATCVPGLKMVNQSIDITVSNPQNTQLQYCTSSNTEYTTIDYDYSYSIDLPGDTVCFTPYGYLEITFNAYSYEPTVSASFTTQCETPADYVLIGKSLINDNNTVKWKYTYFVYSTTPIKYSVGQIRVGYDITIEISDDTTNVDGDIYIGEGTSESPRFIELNNPYPENEEEEDIYQPLPSLSLPNSNIDTIFLDPDGKSIPKYKLADGTEISAIIGNAEGYVVVNPGTEFLYDDMSQYLGGSLSLQMDMYNADTQFTTFPIAPVVGTDNMLITGGWYNINISDCEGNRLTRFEGVPVSIYIPYKETSELTDLQKFGMFKLELDPADNVWKWNELDPPTIDEVNKFYIFQQNSASTYNLDAKVPNFCETLEVNVPIEVASEACIESIDQDENGNTRWNFKNPVRITMEADYTGGDVVSGNSGNFRRFDQLTDQSPIYFRNAPTSDLNGNLITYNFSFFKPENDSETPDATLQYSNDTEGKKEYCPANNPC